MLQPVSGCVIETGAAGMLMHPLSLRDASLIEAGFICRGGGGPSAILFEEKLKPGIKTNEISLDFYSKNRFQL